MSCDDMNVVMARGINKLTSGVRCGRDVGDSKESEFPTTAVFVRMLLVEIVPVA